jgi:transposase InsO family protein
MPKSWFNNGFKYIFACIDVFSKKADMIPLKDREQTTTTKAFEKILNNIGIPKTIYSDQGSEFKNNTFQKLLDKQGTKLHFKSPTAERRHASCVGVGRDRTHAGPPQWSRVCPP